MSISVLSDNLGKFTPAPDGSVPGIRVIDPVRVVQALALEGALVERWVVAPIIG